MPVSEEQVFEYFDNANLLSISEFIKKFETRYGVSAVSPDGQIRVYVGDAEIPMHAVPNQTLDAAGRTLVAVDDTFDNAEQVGLHVVGPDA